MLPQSPGSSTVPREVGPTTQNVTQLTQCEMSEGTRVAQVTFKGCSGGRGSAAGGQNTANHSCRVKLKGKHDLAWSSGRGRQCAWCDKPVSYPKHSQLLSESGESEQPTVGTHPASMEQQLDHMLFV